MFINKKRDGKYSAEFLGIEEEMAKARVRVKISEHDNHDQEMTFKSEEVK